MMNEVPGKKTYTVSTKSKECFPAKISDLSTLRQLENGNSADLTMRSLTMVPKKKKIRINIKKDHQLCNQGEKLLKKSFGKLRLDLAGELQACDGYLRAKARAKCVREKIATTEATVQKECLFIDNVCPYTESIVGSRYWFGIVGDFSHYG